MVQASNKTPKKADGSIDIELWKELLFKRYASKELESIKQALAVCEEYGDLPQSYEMAAILFELQSGPDAIACALLYPLYEYGELDYKNISEVFGVTIAKIIKGAFDMRAISQFSGEAKKQELQIDRLRKMLLTMVNDVRVVLVRLAERLYAMRAAKTSDRATQIKIAKEIQEIYAPLANRLGIGQLKWELEDRAFAYLEPEKYKEIKTALSEKRLAREAYLKNILQLLTDAMKDIGVQAEIQGRVKHIYSIWRKMKKKDVPFEEIFDVRAVRILVRDISSCYQVLGCLHSRWEPYPAEFDDYVSTPKPNGYRSIHTVIHGPQNKLVEVQIRTHAMHEESEMGMAAHWRYKEGVRHDESYETRVNWLRSLLDWQQEVAQDAEQRDEIQHKIIDERIYVFTPQGTVIDLPNPATPLDFAYHVHTDVGHCCRGAKVDGRIVPLTYHLQTGESIEILTTKNGKPSRDWLNKKMGYIYSSRARAKIQRWFKEQERDRMVLEGREVLQKILQKFKSVSVEFEEIAAAFDYKQVDDFLVNLSQNIVKAARVSSWIVKNYLPEEIEEQTEDIEQYVVDKKPIRQNQPMVIQGVDNLLIRTAGCCRPVIGDKILGYITQGRGVTVHRMDCHNLDQIKERHPERMVEVSWGDSGAHSYPVDLTVHAKASSGSVLKEITSLFSNEKVSILSIRSDLDKRHGINNIRMTIEVCDLEQFSRLKDLIGKLSCVLSVKRGG